jgi:hypothetical protein
MSDECTNHSPAAMDLMDEQDRLQQRNALVEDLEAAAIRIRDAQIEVEAAREGYRVALDKFNRFVAPVTG